MTPTPCRIHRQRDIPDNSCLTTRSADSGTTPRTNTEIEKLVLDNTDDEFREFLFYDRENQ